MVEPFDVPIRDGSIRLGQLLKLAGVVDDGGFARAVVKAGEVEVNGTVQTRRGHQVRPGDTVRYAGQTLHVVGTPDAT